MEIIVNQAECDSAFRYWADVLIANSSLTDDGWVIEGRGVVFTNYGHGDHGEITTQVMLGFDPDNKSSAVKIVQPKAARLDKGPSTVLAIDEDGRKYLLREGRLTVNKVSGFIIDNFAELTGLTEVPLMIGGQPSSRHWYVVADLGASAREIMDQAADFSIACTHARNRSGGTRMAEKPDREDMSRPTYGMDEKGRITTRNRPGGTVEICELQGFVFKALKKIVGKTFVKPMRKGYCVDGMVESANLLIEIKTGTAAHNIYEGVGQLNLYPTLIGIEGNPERALIIPDNRPLKPIMVAALDAANITVFTYHIDNSGKKPRITFPDALIERCRRRVV